MVARASSSGPRSAGADGAQQQPEPARPAAETASGQDDQQQARIEKKLNKLDGVTATVNFATETARVSFPAAVGAGDLISVVEQAGYTAALPAARQSAPGEDADRGEAGPGEADALRRRLLVSLTLAIPVVVLAMIRELQFRNWQ